LCCTSLLMTDWYIDGMKMKTYEAEGLPISFGHEKYVGDKRDGILFNKQTENRWDIKDFLNFAKSDKEETMVEMESGIKLHYLPTNKIRVPVDKNKIIANKVVDKKFYDSIVPYIDIDIKGNAIYKNRLMMLDILAHNDWKRPIYFSPGSFGDDDYIWMKDYLQLDGMVYKLVPVKTKYNDDNYPDMGQIDADKMYNTVMKWKWGNGNSTKIYHDPETRKNSISSRNNLSRLMYALIKEGKIDKAKKIINLAITQFPIDYYGYYSTIDPFADGYYKVGEKEKARELLEKIITKYKEHLKYYNTFKPSDQYYLTTDIMTDLYRYKKLMTLIKENGDIDFYNKQKVGFNSYNKMFEHFGGEME
jgi:tetratricopeptide (TPR) repeat protein